MKGSRFLNVDLRVLGLAIVATLLVSACAGQAVPTPAPAAQPTAAPPKPVVEPTIPPPQPTAAPAKPAAQAPSPRLDKVTTMKIVSVPYFGLEYIAKQANLTQKYNLEFEIIPQQVQGVAGVQAMVQGLADTMQGVGVNGPIQARAGGAKVKAVVAGYISGGDFDVYRFYVRADSDIRSAKDLVGKKIGIVNIGAYPDYIILAYLQKNGVDPKSVERVGVPPQNLQQALLSKQIDVAGLYDAFYSRIEAEAKDQVRVLFRDKEVAPSDKLLSTFIFTDDYIQKNPDRVRAFVAVVKDAADFVAKNPEEAKKIIAQETKLDARYMIVPQFPKGNCLDLSSAKDWVKLFVSTGAIKEGSVGETDWLTNEFNPDCR